MKGTDIPIKGLLPMSTIDYKGKIASTIFLQGCNFRCPFCHNPELVPAAGEGDFLGVDEVLSYLKENKDFVDAVCISGGEPTLHRQLPDFISRLKKAGFFVKVQTNGTNPDMLEKLIEDNLLDYLSMDIKAPLDKYDRLAGTKTDIKKIKKSAELIMKSSIAYSFHTTVSPELTLSDITHIGEWLSGADIYVLQQFRPEKTLDESYAKKKPHTAFELSQMADAVRKHFGRIVIEGAEE